ncbi:hypothetical protein ES705_29192 [subsurface metagenome]
MNGDLEQKREQPESRSQPENKLESIRDITRAVKDGDNEYVSRLDVIVNLLMDGNANLEKIIGIGTLLEKHLREIRAGIAAIIASANFTQEKSPGLMAWLRRYGVPNKSKPDKPKGVDVPGYEDGH